MSPTINVYAISLLTVSVVMIALEALVPASRLSSRVALMLFTPPTSFSTGSCIPITPVDATATESYGTPSSFSTALAVASQASQPSLPVHALAIPELTTTACIGLPEDTIFWSHCTHAAFTTLLVNVPAHSHGVWLKTIAISVLSLYLIFASQLAALNPFAAQTPPSILVNSMSASFCIHHLL